MMSQLSSLLINVYCKVIVSVDPGLIVNGISIFTACVAFTVKLINRI